MSSITYEQHSASKATTLLGCVLKERILEANTVALEQIAPSLPLLTTTIKMTVETLRPIADMGVHSPMNRKRLGNPVLTSQVKLQKKETAAAPVAEPPKKSAPKAKNDGWGMFKDRQTFVDMHLC